MLDADLSATPAADVHEDDVLDVLELQTEHVTIVPEDIKSKSEIITAFPVAFTLDPSPAPINDRDRHFKVEIAARGLELEPELLQFTHEYPFELGVEGILVPTMALVEAVAEKSVSYGIFRLAKHYADLAFAVDRYQTELLESSETLREVVRIKLERNVKRFPRLTGNQGITDYDSLKPAFVLDRDLRVVKRQWQLDLTFVGAAANQYTFPQAHELVTKRLVPLLFPK
jgi:hypothetical protein